MSSIIAPSLCYYVYFPVISRQQQVTTGATEAKDTTGGIAVHIFVATMWRDNKHPQDESSKLFQFVPENESLATTTTETGQSLPEQYREVAFALFGETDDNRKVSEEPSLLLITTRLIRFVVIVMSRSCVRALPEQSSERIN